MEEGVPDSQQHLEKECTTPGLGSQHELAEDIV